MVFRADEAARAGFEDVVSYFIPRRKDRDISYVEKTRSNLALLAVLNECGPVVDAYPSWHPLVSNHDSRNPETGPSEACGYRGLDHTRYFANGFITCPYGDGQEVLDSVAALRNHHPIASITAERLDVQLYSPDATPILVKCTWGRPLQDGMIPLAVAMPLILEKEVPCWEWSEVAETWDTMRPYLIGRPHGAKSSLFVSQETGHAIKKIWEALIHTGMFGSIKIRAANAK